jgi:hypothetical protein
MEKSMSSGETKAIGCSRSPYFAALSSTCCSACPALMLPSTIIPALIALLLSPLLLQGKPHHHDLCGFKLKVRLWKKSRSSTAGSSNDKALVSCIRDRRSQIGEIGFSANFRCPVCVFKLQHTLMCFIAKAYAR